MAKTKYIIRRPRYRWVSNLAENRDTSVSFSALGESLSSQTLITNPNQESTRGTSYYTVKNVEAEIELYSSNQTGLNITGLMIYIMYIPEGYGTADPNITTLHPEWILASRLVGLPNLRDVNQEILDTKNIIRVKTRLARKLNTGDKIVLFIKGYNPSNSFAALHLNSLVRWWSRAN